MCMQQNDDTEMLSLSLWVLDGSLYNRHDIPINGKLWERKAAVTGKQKKHLAVLLKLDLQ